MRKLSKPTITAHQVFHACVSAVDDAHLKARLNGISPHVTAAESNFESKATAAALQTFPRLKIINGSVTADEMSALYKDHMSKADSAGRAYYDTLMNAVPHKRCPLCGVGVVSTLDHHLPKSKYADLAVTPLNLVPACADCNKSKVSKHPATAGQQTIHPYFDDFSTGAWLQCQVNSDSPLAVTFCVVQPTGWNDIQHDRAMRHFDVFKLNARFSANANDELSTTKLSLHRVYTSGGPTALQEHLLEQSDRYSARVNSWQFALYTALSQHADFCHGGYQHIAEPS